MCSKQDEIPHIDLTNFELEKFQNSNYVLTSPTSLEACKNLNIKPADLLLNSTENIVNIFDRDKMEKERKLMILRAKIERQRLINEFSASRSNLVVEGKVISGDKAIQSTTDSSNRDQKYLSQDFMDVPISTKLKSQRYSPQNENKPNSLMRELFFHEKRKELEEQAKMEKKDMILQIEHKMSRAERNKMQLRKKKYEEMENKRRIQERKIINVTHRRKQLDNEILKYYHELERFQNMTIRSAEEKICKKLQSEQSKIQCEREYKELVNRHNRRVLEEEETNRNYERLAKIIDKDKQNEQFMKDKLDKMIESRCMAHEAQKVREEIRKIYNLDSFDKKANYAEIINQVIKPA